MTASVLDPGKMPDSLYFCRNEFLLPQSNPTPHTNFLKGVKWSPDGACLCTASDDTCLRIFDLPPDALETPGTQSIGGEDESPERHESRLASLPHDNLRPAVTIPTGECVYDYVWFPRMSALDESTCLLASTSRAQPVNVWSALDGKLKATYRSYDQVDEPEAAFGIAFSPDGSRLITGHAKYMRVFDVQRPGRDHLKTIPTHSKRSAYSMPGLVSCFSFSPVYAGCPDPLFAAGTYQGVVGLFDAREYRLVLLLKGQRGGVTQVQFSADGNYLYTGARKDNDVICWDVRYGKEEVYRMERVTKSTNQRVQFDIEPMNRYLATGGEDGRVAFFDLRDGSRAGGFRAAPDTVNGCMFHPGGPFLATAAGQRRYEELVTGGEDEAAPSGREEDRSTAFTNALRVWRLAYGLAAADPSLGVEAEVTAAGEVAETVT